MPPVQKKISAKVLAGKTTVKVMNTTLTIGDIYEVRGKVDYDAPKGFQDFATTKYLIPGIAEIRGINFDEQTRRWDTGFEVNSPSNSRIAPEEREALVKVYNELIRKPYEEYYNVDCSATNDDFWLTYMYRLHTGDLYDTSKPNELFDLFHALKQGRIVEVGEKDATLQRTAKYTIKDRNRVQTLQEERREAKFEAALMFKNLLDANSEDLEIVLEWIGFASIRNLKPDDIKKQVYAKFEDPTMGYENAQRFLEAVSLTDSKQGKEEMEIFSALSRLRTKQKLEFKRQQFYLDGVLLGNTLKSAAKSAVMDVEKKAVIIDAYEKINK